jgi:cell wall-associated NlpC family hydrolase
VTARPDAHRLTQAVAAGAVVLLAACASAPDPGRSFAAIPPGLADAPSDAPRAATADDAAVAVAGTEVVFAALHYLDVAYSAGGASVADGFDCSGFTRHVYASTLDLALPRRAEDQALRAGWTPVALAELRAGDLVFFDTLGRPHSHVGIYVGGGRFIHAPRTGARVRVEALRQRYWAQRFDGARRMPAEGLARAIGLP